MNFKFWKKDTIRAREFILEDSEGRERAALRMDSADNTLLLFRGTKGEVRSFTGVTSNGTPRIGMLYANGNGSIVLEASDQVNTAALIISGPNGNSKATIAVTSSGVPIIALYDETGKAIVVQHASPKQQCEELENKFTDWDSLLRE
jgi:hypothetical protein